MTECNVKNRTIFNRDNLDILRGINSQCIDLIYLDPPFNKNKIFAAPIGSSAEGAEFSDIFRQEDVKDEWLVTIEEDEPELYTYLNGIKGVGKPYNFAYLSYMAIRLIECRRVLKNTGSIYLHCDSTMSHYLKTTMDCIFGEKNFRNEIVWQRYSGRAKGSQHKSKTFGTDNDNILFYALSDKTPVNPSRPLTENEIKERYPNTDSKGRRYTGIAHFRGKNMGDRPNLCYEWRGYVNPHPSGWRVTKKRLENEYQDGKVVLHENGRLERRRFYDPEKGITIGSLWVDIQPPAGNEQTGYPTQKPLHLLERIIKASSNEGDIVLDPFCGCATTCVTSEKLDRQWIGIDISYKAYELVKERLINEVANPGDITQYKIEVFTDTRPPKRTDLNVDYRDKKFVYVVSNPKYPEEYKVGIASDWRSRLNAYQTSDPDRAYKMEHKLETPDFRTLEKHIHNKFPNKHEWVQADLKDIIEEIKNYKAK